MIPKNKAGLSVSFGDTLARHGIRKFTSLSLQLNDYIYPQSFQFSFDFLIRAVIRIKSRTGKSAEDIRKLFPNFYISNWSKNGNSTAPGTPAVSGRLPRPPPVNPGINTVPSRIPLFLLSL